MRDHGWVIDDDPFEEIAHGHRPYEFTTKEVRSLLANAPGAPADGLRLGAYEFAQPRAPLAKCQNCGARDQRGECSYCRHGVGR